MLDKIRATINSWIEKLKDSQAKGAQKALLEELFNDLYTSRREIYKLNFFRGIFFGFGSVLGGTIVIALLIWLLSLFVNFPLIGDFFQQTQDTLQESTRQ